MYCIQKTDKNNVVLARGSLNLNWFFVLDFKFQPRKKYDHRTPDRTSMTESSFLSFRNADSHQNYRIR